jgi:hypothetical protein
MKAKHLVSLFKSLDPETEVEFNYGGDSHYISEVKQYGIIDFEHETYDEDKDELKELAKAKIKVNPLRVEVILE